MYTKGVRSQNPNARRSVSEHCGTQGMGPVPQAGSPWSPHLVRGGAQGERTRISSKLSFGIGTVGSST